MITKWKTILTNWINCNLNEPTDVPETVNQDSLLNIVSHLHNNCLDESKSSILEAQTLEEFILEKYPAFQFENGTVEAASEEELYTVASLLLFFVCVNSKDADLKNAMCSKLSSGDQELILKYSKCLLECPAVTYKDVKAAILEACGRENSSGEGPAPRATVAETPPALRSLHSEVRRLHAALDAERFDRNYLQEELARTQLRLDNLAKEKEDQKQTILALKAKVSECCGQEDESRSDGSSGDAATGKLRRQIDELEQKLADTMAQLDDLAYERDAYKTKAEELKRERDKCFEFGQQESSNAVRLADQLEDERRAVESLKELVAELRQHNRRNGLDGSQLECDEADASALSLPHNVSLCNEACANVVEVQLGEERARVAELTKHIQNLQDQLTELNQRTEEEKLSLQKIISDKDEDILNLKHRINEGIEVSNHIKAHLGNEITKLTNDVNELEQKIRHNNEHYSRTIEGKMREVQILQEEKLSLLQSLSDETTKLDNVIKDQENTIQILRADLNAEKNSKQRLREDYEAQVMELKEKVLNRNNELVELQNNASKNSETIEALHFEVRKETENLQMLTTELHNRTTLFNARLTQVEDAYKLKIEEVQELQSQLEQKDKLIQDLEKNNTETQQALKETKARLTGETQTRDESIQAYKKQINTLNKTIKEKEQALTRNIDERKSAIAEMTQDIQTRDDTINAFKTEIETLNKTIKEQDQTLTQKIQKKEAAIAQLTHDNQTRDNTIKTFEKEIETLNKTLKEQELSLTQKINEEEVAIAQMTHDIQTRDDTIKAFEKEIETLNKTIKEQDQTLTQKIQEKEAAIAQLTHDNQTQDNTIKAFEKEIKEQEVSLTQKIHDEEVAIAQMTRDIQTRDDTIKAFEKEIETLKKTIKEQDQTLTQKIQENEAAIAQLTLDIQTRDNTIKAFEKDIETLNKTLKEQELSLTQKIHDEVVATAQMTQDIQTRDDTIKAFEKEIESLNKIIKEQEQSLTQKIHDKEAAIAQMTHEIQERNSTIASYEKDIENLNNTIFKQKDNLTRQIKEKAADINLLQVQLTQEVKSCEQEIVSLHNKIKEQEEALTHKINEKEATIALLQMQLQSEITFRNHHQREMGELQKARDSLIAEVEKLSEEFTQLNQETQQKNRIIEAMDSYLHEEKTARAKLAQEYDELKECFRKLQEQFANKCLENDEMVESVKSKLTAEVAERERMSAQVDSMKVERDVNANEILVLQKSNNKLSEDVSGKEAVIRKLEQDLSELTDKYKNLSNDFDRETSKLMTRLIETERVLKELRSKSNKIIENKSLEVQTLRIEIENLQKLRNVDREATEVIQLEKESLVSKLHEQATYQQILEEDYMRQCKAVDEITAQLSKELVHEKSNLCTLVEKVKDYSKDVVSLEEQLAEKTIAYDKLVAQKEAEIEKLTKEIADISSRNGSLSEEFNKEIQSKSIAVKALQKENEKLLYTIEEDNSTHEVLLTEKDKAIENLEQHLNNTTKQLATLQSDFEEQNFLWEKSKLELKESLLAKDNQISKVYKQLTETKESLEKATDDFKQEKENLNAQIVSVKKDLDKARDDFTQEKQYLNAQIEDLKKDKEESIIKLRKEAEFLEQAVAIESNNVKEIIHQKEVLEDQLAEEKGMVETLQSEKDMLSKLTEEKNGYINLLEIAKYDLEVTNSEMKQYLIAEKKAKEQLSEKLSSEIAEKEILIEEKEILSQQLIEEKSFKDLLQNEKKMLLQENYTLMNDKDNLQEQLIDLKNKYQESELEKEVLLKESDHLVQQISEEKHTKEKFVKSKNSLVSLNQTLINKVADEAAINTLLIQEKELLMAEKESLLTNLSEEKAAKDMVENEKEIQRAQLEELKQKQAEVLNSNLEDMKKASEELKILKNNLKEKCNLTEGLTKTLNAGLGKLLSRFQKEPIQNELLKKLITVDNIDEIQLNQQCDLLISIAETLTTELGLRRNLEKALEQENSAMSELREMLKEKEMQLHESRTEYKKLEQSLSDLRTESALQRETLTSNLADKTTLIQSLERENKSLNSEINDVKLQLELKVHSLKEKLADTEVVTDKLKRMYECQIENLNLMADKLTNYLKGKTVELEAARREKEKLQRIKDENNAAIKTLEESVKSHKQTEEKLITDFESERAVLKNMVTVTESVMEDQKAGFEKLLADNAKITKSLEEDNASLKKQVENEKQNARVLLQEKDSAFETLFKELTELRSEKEELQKEVESLKSEVLDKVTRIETAEENKKGLTETLDKNCKELANMSEKLHDAFAEKEELLTALRNAEIEYTDKLQNREIEFNNQFKEQEEKRQELEELLKERELKIEELNHKAADVENKMKLCHEETEQLTNLKCNIEKEKTELEQKYEQFKALNETSNQKDSEEINRLREEKTQLVKIVEENKSVITNLDQLIKHELEQNQQLREQTAQEKLNLVNKCSILEQYQQKAEKEIDEKRKEVSTMNAEIKTLKSILENSDMEEKLIEKDRVIDTVTKDLVQEKNLRANSEKELEMKTAALEVKSAELSRAKDEVLKLMSEREGLLALRKANEELFKSVSQRETLLTAIQEKAAPGMTKQHGDSHQVAMSPDTTHTSPETTKTIVDLETIIHDKNRTITALQSDVTYLKTQIKDSETKMEHLNNELEISKETCTQLSNQLKKVVLQKNEEIADLKKQVSKMSVTENRASQIIKVSAKYQTIILKRIAEIKSNTVLKELTNFGNAANVDNELRRSIAGSVTMEDLENFLETTDRHLKRCSEKQIALQKERDRLSEVNKINESEIINLKKFLTEMSVSFKTFVSVKDVYAQRLSRIVSLQRTVRREILNLDGKITDAAMCHLERGYTAVMQDLAECAMNLERWVERSISRTISAEKIKQAFASELDRASMACGSFQNAGLEVQLDELEASFKKLLEEVSRAPRGEGAKDAQAVTVMEVRAEYEDKLNRMKSKMKQLYQEQIAIFRDKQKEEVAVLERELQKTRDKMADSSRAYESHIRSLTAELWSVGEKFLMKKDEAEWLRRNRSGSLQSLQHVHSSGLAAHDESINRPSDAASLRSLPIRPKKTGKGGRGLHMSDEEGEVFDNQCLKELSATPRAARSPPAGARLSELRWRNSLCPPHLKSSYPAETQFAELQEDEIKCAGKQQRKEVGITAYKKPGPPTPSKQAGRLSATDSELRDSLRPEAEPPRKTSTPSRLRALFRSSRADTADGTPRSRRLSIFRSNK